MIQFPKYICESTHTFYDERMCEYLNGSLVLWAVKGVLCSNTCPYFVLLGSESSTVEINISSELRDYDDVDADGESLENSLRH